MHIPAYAHATIRAAAPNIPTARQAGGLDCCLCDTPFEDRVAVPLGPTETSGFFGCHPCLTRLVRQARRTRDAELVEDAERARAEAVAWEAERDRRLGALTAVRQAAEAVTRLAAEGEVEPLRVAWLHVSLESAYAWASDDAPEPPGPDEVLRDADMRLTLEMFAAREAVANRLSYHLIDRASPPDPEECEEYGCSEECDGRHDTVHIDCGP
ncbi:hypothetical protein ABZ896_50550, partial [Streptomyces sp. NPDC047072]